MKVLKRVLIVLAIIIAIPLILAAFLNKNFDVSREVTISKPNADVFAYIRCLKNQDYYSVWNQLDPDMKKDYKGTDGEVGFVASWESTDENVGKGSQEITSIKEGSSLETHLTFKEPFESESDAYMLTEAKGEGATTVKWGVKGTFAYPMNLMLLFWDMDAEMGPDLENGLKNLKTVLESEGNE